MRKLFLSAVAVIALAGATTVNANTLSNPLTVNTVQDSTTQTTVKLEELPDSVKTLLASDPYKEWSPTSALLIKSADGAEYYRVDVSKGEEKAFLKINKDGKVIE